MKNAKVVYSKKYEDVIENQEHLFIKSKKDRICVLPYTIDSKNLIDKIGVTHRWNDIENEEYVTIIHDYMNTDDNTNLVGANRILFSVIGTNVEDASRWMFLGTVYNSTSSESPLKLYAVNISDVELKENKEVENQSEKKKFDLLETYQVLQSDDLLFLGAFLRLFSYFYITNLNNMKNFK